MFLLWSLFFIVLFYLYSTWNHKYWKKMNVKHDTPIPLFGNHFKNCFGVKSKTEVLSELYYKYPGEKVVGYYRGNTPQLILRDLQLVKDILNKDFTYFYARGTGSNRQDDPLAKNVFHADGDTWYLLRKRLSPAFTSSKLKKMFPLITTCTERLQLMVEKRVQDNEVFDVRELFSCFTTDAIISCGFGLDTDTINNNKSIFRTEGKKVFEIKLKELILYGVVSIFPQLRKLMPNLQGYNLIASIVKTGFEQRNCKPTDRNDFIDILLALSAKGKIMGDSIEHKNDNGTSKTVELKMDFNICVSNVFLFYAAGYETSSFSSAVTLHQIAFHPEIQLEVQKEIDEVLLKYGKLCYDAVNEMIFLQMCFKESIRILSSAGVTQRICCKRYTHPSLGFTIEPGTLVYIPIQAIQLDEYHFENPNEFKPRRFSPGSINSTAFLAFGDGPRACLGARLGQMQSLAGIAAILQKFTVEPTVDTPRVLPIDPWINIVQGVKGKIPLKFSLRKK